MKNKLEFFEQETERYERSFYSHPRWAAYRHLAAHSLLPLLPQSFRVLDVGSGPAPSLPAVFEKAGRYVCLDGSSANLKRLLAHVPGCSAAQADLSGETALPVRGSFDLVIIFGLLQYLCHPSLLVEQLASLVKAGGYLLSHDPSAYWTGRMPPEHGRGFSKEELLELFQGKFKVVWLRSFHHVILERRLSWLFPRLRLPQTLVRPLWLGIFLLERLLDGIGIRGTDWMLLAQKPKEPSRCA